MGTNQDYKNRALQALEGNWSDACIVTLIYLLIAGVLSDGFTYFMSPEMSIGTTVMWAVLCAPLGWSLVTMFLTLVRDWKSRLTVSNLFEGYHDFGRIMTTYLLMYVFLFLWTLLLIVPGIIKSFSYAMTPYILKDNPNMRDNEAIELSMRMMEGHKWELFWLYLSFIGWFLLSLLTLGIGFIFLLPYVYASVANFYEDLKAQQNGRF